MRTQSYSYDPFGNLSAIVTSPALQTDRASISVDTASNRVTDAGFAYDDAGNMTQHAGVAFAWDSIGTMRSKTEAPWRQEVYLYAPGGERIATFNLTNGTSTRTLRDLDGRVLRELTGAGPGGATLTFSRDYVYRGDALLASESGEGQRHFHLDHLGTPRLITNASGQRDAYHSYYPFGQEATSKAQDTFRLKFTGHERDFAVPGGASDLDYMHARYYSPLVGRFVSVDPLGDSYWYVRGRPLTLVDPSGLQASSSITVNAPDPCPQAPSGMSCSEYALLLRRRQDFDDAMRKLWRRTPSQLSAEAKDVATGQHFFFRDFPQISLRQNLSLAQEHCCFPLNVYWFYKQVRNKGPWDFKQHGRQYEIFGNVHFGMVAAAAGIPKSIALRGAGFAQLRSGNGYPWFGQPLGGPMTAYTFGDDPVDGVAISLGYDLYTQGAIP